MRAPHVGASIPPYKPLWSLDSCLTIGNREKRRPHSALRDRESSRYPERQVRFSIASERKRTADFSGSRSGQGIPSGGPIQAEAMAFVEVHLRLNYQERSKRSCFLRNEGNPIIRELKDNIALRCNSFLEQLAKPPAQSKAGSLLTSVFTTQAPEEKHLVRKQNLVKIDVCRDSPHEMLQFTISVKGLLLHLVERAIDAFIPKRYGGVVLSRVRVTP